MLVTLGEKVVDLVREPFKVELLSCTLTSKKGTRKFNTKKKNSSIFRSESGMLVQVEHFLVEVPGL